MNIPSPMIYIETESLGLNTKLAITRCGHGETANRLYALVMTNEDAWEDVTNGEDKRRHWLRLRNGPDGSSSSLLVLAQRLWDLGIRPREAINHDQALEALRSERDFLRKLVLRHEDPSREDVLQLIHDIGHGGDREVPMEDLLRRVEAL